MPRSPHPLVSCLLLAAAFTLAAPAAGADQPVVTPRPDAPGEETALPLTVADPSDAPLVPFVVPAEPGVSRESLCTDPGRTAGPALPTEHELAKLELARAAIEASRAAGTLYSATPPVPAPDGPPAPAAAKERVPTSHPFVPDAAAAIGDFPARQEVGPPGPSEGELDKVRRHREEVRHD